MGGLFGVAAKDSCAKDVFYGTDYHSHLAAEWAGIAITTEKGIFRRRKHIKSSQFKSRFSEILALPGSYGIGVMSDDRQPVCERSKLGNFALATDATILNINEIVNELLEQGISLSEASFEHPNTTEIISKLIHQKNSVEEGIIYALKKISGCCTFILLNEDGIYAARDTTGVSSLVLGKRNDACAVATETCAFPNLGFKIEKFIAPGEIIFFNENGYRTVKVLENSKLKECIFYHSYFSEPTAIHEGVAVEESRNRCGEFLASADLAEGFKADLVSGVPDSGIGHAIGYANKSGIPFGRALVKYTAGWSRSYMPPTQDRRDEIAYYKLNPIPSLIKGKRLVIVDDSIRRGTQLRKLLLEKILPYEPKEVHVRIGSPPQLFACIRDKADESRLAARRAIKAIEGKEITDYSEYMDINSEKYRKMVEFMANEISATSLAFISIEDAVKATTLPEGNHCIYCWTGKMVNPPISQKKVTAYND